MSLVTPQTKLGAGTSIKFVAGIRYENVLVGVGVCVCVRDGDHTGHFWISVVESARG